MKCGSSTSIFQIVRCLCVIYLMTPLMQDMWVTSRSMLTDSEHPACRPLYLLSLFLGFVPRCYCFKKKNILTMFFMSGPLSDMYFFKLVVAKNHNGKVLSVELELNIN